MAHFGSVYSCWWGPVSGEVDKGTLATFGNQTASFVGCAVVMFQAALTWLRFGKSSCRAEDYRDDLLQLQLCSGEAWNGFKSDVGDRSF